MGADKTVELSEELARTFMMTKHAAETDPRAVRDQFEALAREEEGLREHARRWEDIAARRAAREEGGLGGYASTAIGRTIGLPRGLGELLFRGGAAGMGAYAGGRLGGELGEHYARIPSGSLASLLAPVIDKGESKPSMIQRRLFSAMEPSINEASEAIQTKILRDAYPGLEDTLKREGRTLKDFASSIDAPEAQRAERVAKEFRTRFGTRFNQLFRDLSEKDPEVVSKALSSDILEGVPSAEKVRKALTSRLGERVARNIPGVESSEVQALRNRLVSEFGEENMPTVRRMIQNALEEAKLPSGLGRWSRAGKWLGAGAGALVSGLPFAAYALWAKHKGGERAQKAKAEARRLLSQSEEKSLQREELLNSLEAASNK